jgi:hypothetical protein
MGPSRHKWSDEPIRDPDHAVVEAARSLRDREFAMQRFAVRAGAISGLRLAFGPGFSTDHRAEARSQKPEGVIVSVY